MNFFPFHPGDYMLRTAHLDPIEDLAYRRLIDLYYVNEAPLSGSSEELSRVIRLRKNSEQVAAVLQEFFVETEGGSWSHSHCDEVIEQYRSKARQAAENGKRGGRPRKTETEPNPNLEETQPVISANPEETGSKANQEPITNNQEDQHNTPSASEPDFPEAESLDPKSPCEMTLDWKPDDKLLKAYALRMALPVGAFTDEATASFVCHYSATGRCETQASWVSLLVKWIKRDTSVAGNVRQFPVKRQANGPDFNDTTWSDDLGDL